MTIRLTNSLDNKRTTPETEAPSTLRIPISLVFCSVVKEYSNQSEGDETLPKLSLGVVHSFNMLVKKGITERAIG